MIKGNIHSLQSLGTVDGPGIRFVVFVQGCNLRCGCCHNPDTWEINGGTEYTPEQTTVADTSDEQPADTPKHGEKKDGKIYINGFGWVTDNGGGGQAEYADDMYENGNKIGYFG